MITARWRKVRADLLTNKVRSGLAVISLAVGTTAVGALVLAGDTLDASFESSLRTANPPSAVLVTDPFDADLVDEVLAHPAVGQAEARRSHRTQVAGPAGDHLGIELVAMPDFGDNHVALIDPRAGTWPPSRDGIVLERASISELGVSVGEDVSVEIPGETPLELTVTGTVSDVTEVAPMLGGSVRGYVAMETMTELTGSDDLNTFYLRATDQPLDRDSASEMTAAVRDDVLRPAGVALEANHVENPSEHPADKTLSFIVLTMQVLSLFGLAIAIGLVVNTVTALLAQQRHQLGVMKAIGGTVRQLTVQYLGYVGLLSAGALVVAVPTSLLGGRAVAGFIAGLANIDLDPMGIPLTPVLLQVVIATLLPLAAVVFAVRRACRTTVRDAITNQGLSSTTSRGYHSSRFSRQTLLAYRNAVRNRLRLGLTILTVALCGSVLVGVSSTGSALGHVTEEVAGYTDYDVEIALTDPVPFTEADDILRRDQAVDSVEGWWRGQASLLRPNGTQNQNISITGTPAGSSAIDPTLQEGRWFDGTDDFPVVINTDLAEAEPDLEVGDPAVLEIDGQRREWNVVGIATTTTVGPVAYLPTEQLAATVGAAGQANTLAVQLAAGTDHDEAADRLGTLAGDTGLPVGQVQTSGQIREGLEGIVAVAIALLLFIGAILAVVAVVGVAGTMTLSVFEQTREIGVLRTIGATTWAVRRLLLLQGVAVAAIGGLIGILLSMPVAWLLAAAIENTVISADLPLTFSWLAVGIWLPVAMAIGALGATQPARAAARLTVRDTLAYE
ncbi:MAG TPA: ABC transporter permease [Jiangellales bacterium]|nr:ABC transporter permease [Jiangellales bacterium]